MNNKKDTTYKIITSFSFGIFVLIVSSFFALGGGSYINNFFTVPNGNFTNSLKVGGQNVCLANGTYCLGNVVSDSNVSFQTVNSSTMKSINYSLYNTSEAYMGALYIKPNSVYLTFDKTVKFEQGIYSSTSIYSDQDIYASTAGRSIWAGGSSETTAKAVLNGGGILKLNTTAANIALACTSARAGWVVYNETTFHFYGCNSTTWKQLD